MINYDEFYPATFISTHQYCGFQINHKYDIKVSDNKPYGVMVTVVGENDFESACHYCNLKSIERAWKIEV